MVVFENKDDDNEIDIEDTEEPNEIVERFIITKKLSSAIDFLDFQVY